MGAISLPSHLWLLEIRARLEAALEPLTLFLVKMDVRWRHHPGFGAVRGGTVKSSVRGSNDKPLDFCAHKGTSSDDISAAK